MQALVSRHPIEIAAMPPPSPPLLPKPKHSDTPMAYPNWNYLPSNFGRSVLNLNDFVQDLRLLHRKTVVLPAPNPPSDLNLSAYMRDILMRQSADLLGQMYSKDIRAVTLDLDDPDECISAVTFCAYDDQGVPVHTRITPVLLYVPGDLFHLDAPSPRLSSALKQVHDVDKQSPVIATNFHEVVVFKPLLPDNTRPYERINWTKDVLLALRTVTAAYLHSSLLSSRYIPIIGTLEPDDDELPLKGPPIDPKTPMLADDEVFTTFKRHSDFDLVSLQWDKERALQFFRWKEHLCATELKLIAHPGDIVHAERNRLNRVLPAFKPSISLDISEVPQETLAHATSVQRPCPLHSAGLRSSFLSGTTFTLEILDVVSEGSALSICTVYKCRLTSIDCSEVKNSPVLCVKLFDDRFQRMYFFEEEKEPLELPYGWMFKLAPAEWQAREEHAAYTKLDSFQGSLFPWYYGTHMFTLPNELQVYGVLLEYVPGWSLGSEDVRILSTELQIQAIQSCRHAIRVLDIADIAPQDWHSGQVLVHRVQNGDVHVVLIDLAACTQTVDLDNFNELRNFAGAFHALASTLGSGLDRQLVVDHFGRPDPWDPVTMCISIPVGPPEAKQYKSYAFTAPDPFGFEIPGLS